MGYMLSGVIGVGAFLTLTAKKRWVVCVALFPAPPRPPGRSLLG